MAATDPQNQLPILICDFASEKSHGERKIVGLKKLIEELRSELKGYEVELAMHKASIQPLEARIYLIQDEISIAGSNLESLKNEEEALRDAFIDKMFELNAEIRACSDPSSASFAASGLTKKEIDKEEEKIKTTTKDPKLWEHPGTSSNIFSKEHNAPKDHVYKQKAEVDRGMEKRKEAERYSHVEVGEQVGENNVSRWVKITSNENTNPEEIGDMIVRLWRNFKQGEREGESEKQTHNAHSSITVHERPSQLRFSGYGGTE